MRKMKMKNDIDTYIDKEKFQFITSFEKKEITNTKGEKIIIDFGELTVDERVFLSAFLTYVVQNEGVGKKVKATNLYDIIFNFNGNKRKATSFHDAFIDTISEFLRTKPHFAAYVVDYYNEIIDNKTTIYRTQLNKSEMDALYSLKFQRSYKSLCNVLYIIGVAKSNIRTKQLNKISMDRFYKTAPSLTKKRIDEIMKKLCIGYNIVGDTVYFGNGFNIELAEKYASEAKKKFENQLNEEDIINSIPVINNPAVKSEEDETQVKQHIEPVKEEKDDYLIQQMIAHHKEDDEFDKADPEERRRNAQEKIKSVWSEYYYKDTNVASKLVRKWSSIFDYNTELEKIQKKFNVKPELIEKAINNDYFDDADGGLEMKKRLIAELKELRNQITLMVKVEKIFGEGDEKYLFMGYMYTTHEAFMQL